MSTTTDPAILDYYLRCALAMIDAELERVTLALAPGRPYDSPFRSTGASFKCGAFEAHAYYSAGEDAERPYNFKWRNFEVSWYKTCGRGLATNRAASLDEMATMLRECLDGLEEFKREASRP